MKWKKKTEMNMEGDGYNRLKETFEYLKSVKSSFDQPSIKNYSQISQHRRREGNNLLVGDQVSVANLAGLGENRLN